MTQIQPPPAGSPYPEEPTPGGQPPAGPYGPAGSRAAPPGIPSQPEYYGPPPAGMPPGYPPYPPQQPPRGTNTLAIIALVLAFLIAPVGLILGIVALSQIRKRGEGGTGLAVAGVVIGAIGTLFYVGVGLLLALATPTLETSQIETRISSATAQAAGTAPTAVSCPDSIDVAPGTTFTCTATVDGQNLPFTVTQKDDQGNVDFQSTGWAVAAKAEKELTDAAAKNFPDTRWTSTCADGKAVVVGGPGTTFSCTLSVADNPAQSEQHTVTITNANGDITIE
jgi:hypothetical protein